MVKNIIGFVMITMITFLSSTASGQSNDVYIEQVGDSLTLTIEQQGETNNVGNVEEDFILDGDNITVNILQEGDGNSIDGQIVNADGVAVFAAFVGDSNNLDINMGEVGEVTDSTVDVVVIGDTNDIQLTTAADGTAIASDVDIHVVGGLNEFVSTIESDNATLSLLVDGDANIFATEQSGWSDHSATVMLTGSDNAVDILQENTSQSAIINIESTMSDGSIAIIQTDTAGP